MGYVLAFGSYRATSSATLVTPVTDPAENRWVKIAVGSHGVGTRGVLRHRQGTWLMETSQAETLGGWVVRNEEREACGQEEAAPGVS